MSNTSKYYTPEKEELHIGLEYQFRPRLRKGILSYINNDHEYTDTWVTKVLGKERHSYHSIETFISPLSFDDVLAFLEDEAIRVKHLDKVDFESLGFSCKEKPPVNKSIEFNKKPEEGKDVRITLFDDKTLYIRVTIEGVLDKEIVGIKIKNKSELKKVLKMLGVK